MNRLSVVKGAVRKEATAVILAGGRSVRMGRDKFTLQIGGVPVICKLALTLASLCEEVIIVISADRKMEQIRLLPDSLEAVPGLRLVHDRQSRTGPLAGIHAGMTAARFRHCLVTACDIPFPSRKLASGLLAETKDTVMPVVAPQAEEGLHPLFAVYNRGCLPLLEKFIANGERSALEFILEAGVRTLPPERVRELDRTGMGLFDINRPIDYMAAQNYAAGQLAAGAGHGVRRMSERRG
ncbi:molybdenum cofactor guanylyltransferase [Paenibacillus chitinolyticus]|uniref:molybdenum cofactor guanylyltransferase n=1 Tax=Paenibacillus chitinolyticus TaxID=79263 RepID=UPI002DBCF105|nr:molybdenum cofactor guanylyltransferase [Paenibacillus chitinolyticus]MEC0249576.1 molybdenum cofactor guanylyltransferase [Paenibacillus chitinolyticus]